jgi:GTP-binding protein Era
MKAGFIGLIGLPNSGKSTLLNLLVGEKVSIVTAKPQTTRRRAMGIVNGEGFQAVFVDAPGLVSAQSGLNQFLRDEAMQVVSESDVLIAVLNIDEGEVEKLDGIIELVTKAGKPWIALIHKTDLPQLHRPRILRERLEAMNVPVVEGSSLNGTEQFKKDVVAAVQALLPATDRPLFDEELYTVSTMRELCAEIIRERCFENLHQEVPFGTAVKIHRFTEDDGPTVVIEAEVILAKENHRPIVIGRGGQVLKKIGTEARKEIVKLIGRKVFLDLRVSARPGWQKNPMAMKELGYVHGQA